MQFVDFLVFYCLAPQGVLLYNLCNCWLIEMVRTKNTIRKYPTGLPPARYPSIATGIKERNRHYQQLQLVGAEAPETDWTELTPTFEEPMSPAVTRTVDQLNREFEELPPQTIEELSNLVEDLRSNPPTPVAAKNVMGTAVNVVEEPNLVVQPSTSAPTIITETVAETPRAPLLLARWATAVPAPTKSQPRPPTNAVKCPRPNLISHEEPRRKKKKPASLTALQEIRKYQSNVEPLLPLLPFIRVVRELLNQQGPYRITREAILALRTVVEDHLVSTLEGANLACMHRSRCTLAPQDIRLYRRLSGEDEKVGQTEDSREARRRDWARFKEGRLTPAEATVLDTERRRKLRALMARRRQRAMRSLKN